MEGINEGHSEGLVTTGRWVTWALVHEVQRDLLQHTSNISWSNQDGWATEGGGCWKKPSTDVVFYYDAGTGLYYFWRLENGLFLGTFSPQQPRCSHPTSQKRDLLIDDARSRSRPALEPALQPKGIHLPTTGNYPQPWDFSWERSNTRLSWI